MIKNRGLVSSINLLSRWGLRSAIRGNTAAVFRSQSVVATTPFAHAPLVTAKSFSLLMKNSIRLYSTADVKPKNQEQVPDMEQVILNELERQKEDFRSTMRQKTDEQILEELPWILRKLMKNKIKEIRAAVFEHSGETQDKEKEKPSWIARLAQSYHREAICGAQSDHIFVRIQEHVKRPELYDTFNMNKDLFSSEFFLWTVCLWFLYRRLRFEGEDGAIISKFLSDKFWSYVQIRLSRLGVGEFSIGRVTREHEEIFYGILSNFDAALNLDIDTDALIVETLWRNIYGTERPVDASQLNAWIKYIRFHMCYFDHMDAGMLRTALWRFYLPTDKLLDARSSTTKDHYEEENTNMKT